MSYGNNPLNRIVNPDTGRKVDLNGEIGKRVLSNYIITMTGGRQDRGCVKSMLGYWRCETCDELNDQLSMELSR